MYLATTHDVKDSYIYLIDQELYDWIQTGENPPKEIVDLFDYEYGGYDSCEDVKRWDTRATSIQSLDHLECFFSIGEMMAYVQKNNIEIKGEFDFPYC